MACNQKRLGQMKNMVELTTADIHEFTEWFKYFDKDGNGKLDFEEFKKALYAMGCNPTESEVEEVWRIADADGNGDVDWDEYLKLLQYLRKDPNEEKVELIEAFRRIDKCKNNTVTRSQMRRMFEVVGCSYGDMSKKDLELLLDKVDSNGDGLIDIDEFVTCMLDKPIMR